MAYGLGTPQGLSKTPPSKLRLEDYGHRKTNRATPHEDKNQCFVWFIFICFYFEQGKYRKLRINWLFRLQYRPLSLA